MSFFQNSVLNKHLKVQDEDALQAAYERFTAYFHDAARQQNIRESKEEQFQEGFLRELFVKILGYTLNPEPDYNLTTELKNEKGAKKADGAILKDGKALGVVELKGTDTKDLDKINEQAFNYKNNHSACVYVITSNFEKLRFFIHNAVEHLEFNLFTLTPDEFKLLWLCLQADNLLSGVPLKVKEESLLAEENITKQLYKDYSAFKTAMWQNMVKNQPKEDQLVLFKKTQKLLDRFLFIFFAEDSGLLPPNSITTIINKWKHDTDWGEDKKLYDIYKQYFGFINKGRPAKGGRAEIFGYNGGLFEKDKVLDNLKIDDEVLLTHTEKLTAYDFQSEVDVNILGHIFENSLNEIENITAQLEGQEIDKSKTKRKKDGVFYTPKYITKYIVDNTIGKLCEEKKEELNITDERFGQASKRSRKGIADLQAYRDWLLDLKICDPACGSGAFLNQVLEFLIDEHRYLDELTAQYHKSPLVLSDIEAHILEQNIYGVDINEESVEIAKLSLWLRTAQRGRKLTSLNNNIKCGNSLIDDPSVAGEKAFNWQKEFPKVFDKGGFDAVIGNPPYVNLYNMDQNHRLYFESSDDFNSTYLKYDLYVLFFDKGFNILKETGLLAFIVPSVILSIPYGKLLREKIVKDLTLERVVDFTGFRVFADAMVESCILGVRKSKLKKAKQNIIIQKPKLEVYDFEDNSSSISQEVFKTTEGYQFRIDLDEQSVKIIEKIKSKSDTLEAFYYISKGIVAFSKVDDRKKDDFLFNQDLGPNYYPYLEGRDVDRYIIRFDGKFLAYNENIMSRPTFPELHLNPKIIIRAISGGINATFDDNGYFIDQKLIICSARHEIERFIKPSKRPKTKIISNNGLIDYYSTLAILNSKLSAFFYAKMLKGGVSVLPEDIRQFPMNFSNLKIRPVLSDKTKNILKLFKSLNDTKSSFIQLLVSKFSILKPTNKLNKWHELEYSEFIKELEKIRRKLAKNNNDKYVKLSLEDEDELIHYFNKQKQKAQELKSEIDRIDKEIDQMVYELYGLTEEEIKVVEGS